MSHDLKRIYPSTVPELYRRVGMRPVRFKVRTDENCGCILGAIAAERGANVDVPKWPDVAKALGGDFSTGYIFGLARGFDGRPMAFLEDEDASTIAGHADGKAAWEALVEAGMVGGDA